VTRDGGKDDGEAGQAPGPAPSGDAPAEETTAGGEPGTATGATGATSPDAILGKRRHARPSTMSHIADAGQQIGKAGQQIGKAIKSGAIRHVATSGVVHRLPTTLPREQRNRRILLRSILIGFFLIATWIGIMVGMQLLGERKGPDFRTQTVAFFTAITDGAGGPEAAYEQASPRFQEVMLKDTFLDTVGEITRTLGRFREIATVISTETTRGPGGRGGRISARLSFDKGTTTGGASFHYVDGRWRLLGFSVDIPPELKAALTSQAAREERSKGPEGIKTWVEEILALDRDGKAGEIWDNASRRFKAAVGKDAFIDTTATWHESLGTYVAILDVLRATQSPSGKGASFVATIQFSKQVTQGSFDFVREDDTDEWRLSLFKLVIPLPRVPIAPEADETE
jgi:hypothetical protein